MNKFSKETAITTLSPYLNTINECIRGGFQDFFKVNSSNDSLVKGTKASIIHDHTVSRVSEAFEKREGTHY